MAGRGNKSEGKQSNDVSKSIDAYPKSPGGKKRKSKPTPTHRTDISPVRSESASASSPSQQANGKSRSVSEPYKLPNSILPTPIPVRPSLLKRFYEALVLLYILGRNRGDPQQEEELEPLDEPHNLNSEKLRRSFVRSLAYLCDYDKGGAQTTAIALQQTPQSVVYWFASNQMSQGEDRVKTFLSTVLCSLALLERRKASQLEAELFVRAVRFSSKRISVYIKLLQPEILFVLDYLESASLAEDSRVRRWLSDLAMSLEIDEDACEFCYASRNCEEYQELKWRARAGAPCSKKFDTIRHLVGRLNHTMKAVKIIVASAIELPDLFDDIKIERVPSSRLSKPPLQERDPSLNEIVGRMLTSPKEIEELRSSLQFMDEKHGLSETLKEQCADKNWKPRVHAELLILDFFSTQKLDFVGGDRFIGCSKPACYCCFQYIQAHPGRWAAPACHNNHWINWKPPEIFGENKEEEVKAREKILNDIAQKIRNEAIQQIKERRAPARRQPDSNTEISTVMFQNTRGMMKLSTLNFDQPSFDHKLVDKASEFHQTYTESDAAQFSDESLSDGDTPLPENREDEEVTEKDGFSGEKSECEDDDDDEDDNNDEGGGVSL